jgi:galactose mutarotase-like enzyme
MPSASVAVRDAPRGRYAVALSSREGFGTVQLRDEATALEAELVPAAGMLVSSLRHRGAELLWQGEGVGAYAGDGAFMGVPVLHPWANRLARFTYELDGRVGVLRPDSPAVTLDALGQPIHGLLGASALWEVREARATPAGAHLVAQLDFGAHDELLRGFPFPHRVRIDALLHDNALTIKTTVRNTGDAPVPLAFGYHPYLQLPGVDRREWQVVLPVTSRMVLDERMIPIGESVPVVPYVGAVGARSWDDAFDGLRRPARFQLRGGGRIIELELSRGYRYAQVFSPPGAPFICFEPMAAPANALVTGAGLERVASGRQASASFVVRVREA